MEEVQEEYLGVTCEYAEPEHGDYGACYDGKVAEPEAE